MHDTVFSHVLLHLGYTSYCADALFAALYAAGKFQCLTSTLLPQNSNTLNQGRKTTAKKWLYKTKTQVAQQMYTEL